MLPSKEGLWLHTPIPTTESVQCPWIHFRPFHVRIIFCFAGNISTKSSLSLTFRKRPTKLPTGSAMWGNRAEEIFFSPIGSFEVRHVPFADFADQESLPTIGGRSRLFLPAWFLCLVLAQKTMFSSSPEVVSRGSESASVKTGPSSSAYLMRHHYGNARHLSVGLWLLSGNRQRRLAFLKEQHISQQKPI